MSCFNCYSTRKIDADLVDKILERGHRLRSAMVQSILNNDPLNPHIINIPEKKSLELDDLPQETNDKIKAFLQGDSMSREDEVLTLETLRSMSATDLCRATDRTYRSKDPCECLTCFKYKDKDLSCDLKRADGSNTITQKIQEKYKSEVRNYLKFVDSLKISVNSVVLNEAGDKKVMNSLVKEKVAGVGQTFFLQYQIPEVLAKNHQKNKGKVNSGLDSGNLVRFCSRRSNLQEAITNNKENSMALGSDDLSSNGSDFADFNTPSIIEKFQSFEKVMPEKSKSKHFDPFIPKLRLVTPKSAAPIEKSIPITRKAEPIIQKPRKTQLVAQKPEKSDAVVDVYTKPVLFGFVYISEAQFSREVMNSYLNCQLFGFDEVTSSKLVAFGSNPIYNYSQQIPLVCEEEFLLKLRDNFMVVEFRERGESKEFLIGLTKLPLHQFYLAYRNSIIVKYLTERKLPIIGTDGWESIFNFNDGEVVGQAQILVALGTKEQIENLECERGFKKNTVKAKETPISKTVDIGIQSNMEPKKDVEQPLDPIVTQPVPTENSTNTESEVRSTSDLLDSLQKALAIDSVQEKNCFRAQVLINSALHLPSRRKCKSKRSKGRNSKHEDILPSTYVSFEGHKGDLRVTPIVPKSTSPTWDFRCDVSLPIEYLNDNQKFLVFKVWRKSTNTTMTPNMQCDHVIGFATIDCTVLLAGLPSVEGWFNINDLAKKCNGQVNIHVTPLENVSKYRSEKFCAGDPLTPESVEPALESNELLGRALKRKFTELDEITQRLRLRLSKITNDESDTSNDEIADEFERDINTLCVEDDFDTVDFEKEARSFNLSRGREVGLLRADQNLNESKQKIDLLLEKLSLLSGETSSRYVSGCSDARFDTESFLNELEHNSRPNLHSSASFSREMEQKFGSLMNGNAYRSGPEGEGNVTETKSGD